MIIFTICSNNYLAQATVLGDSIKKANPTLIFKIFLCDKKSSLLNYDEIKHEIIEIGTFEPKIAELAKIYNIIELNTAVKPAVFTYLFSKPDTKKVVYLDPDIFVFSDLKMLEAELDTNSVLLTPHIFNPIPLDKKYPNENLFLNHGIYNLGFIGLRNDDTAKKLLVWWQNHTYENGFIDLKNGVFVDQLPMNFAPLFFEKVKILAGLGYNMGPWNLHERKLVKINDQFLVNGKDILHFYHFSSFKLDTSELPVNYYSRYKMIDRPDLEEIHQDYNSSLKDVQFARYRDVKSFYSKIREQEIERISEYNWSQKSMLKKALALIKQNIPPTFKSYLR